MPNEDYQDEVVFWQNLINWWEANNDTPIPERMYLALEYAKALRDEVDSAPENKADGELGAP